MKELDIPSRKMDTEEKCVYSSQIRILFDEDMLFNSGVVNTININNGQTDAYSISRQRNNINSL